MLIRRSILAVAVLAAALPLSLRAQTGALQSVLQPVLQRMLVLAEAGNPEAQYHVGMFYNNGVAGAPVDRKAAYGWFQKSAAGLDPLGAYKLGCYLAGQFPGVVPLDLEGAYRHKLVAAQAGYALAQFDVGAHALRRGEVVGAVQWLEQALAQGNAQAAILLSWSHHNGKTMPRDPVKAYRYLTLYPKVSGQLPNAQMQAELVTISKAISPEQRAQADAEVLAWRAAPSELTLQARDSARAIGRLLAN